MAPYLLVISDREALGWLLTTRRMAFRNAHRWEVRSLSEGDQLFLYTTRGAFKKPSRDRGRVITTASVIGQVRLLSEPVLFGDREYPYGCDLKVDPPVGFGSGVDLATVVDRLESFRDAGAGWPVRLRRPLVRLTSSDADLLCRELNALHSRHGSSEEHAAGYLRWYRPTEA